MKQILSHLNLFISRCVINNTPAFRGFRIGLVCLSLAVFGVNDAWGKYKANVAVKSSPNSGGYVYVGTSNSCGEGNCTKNEDNASQTGGGALATSGNVTLYLCHKNANNYIFKGWSTSNTSNSGEGATSNPYSKSFAGSASTFGGKNYTYYAIFARMTADILSKDFGNVNVGQSSSATTITVTHAHASKITAALSGTNASDFKLSKTTIVDNSVSESTATFTVTFKPTCNGTREATLTLSSTNGLSNVTISLSGTGVLNSQSLSWNNESTIELNMLNGATQSISATATSGLEVSYFSSNLGVLLVDASGKLTAKSVGEATITASQAGDCTYSAATSISKTFNVKSKDTPIFTPNWSSTDIKVGDKVTLGVQYVSDGLSGDFKAKDYNSDILKVTREGNTITIEALNAGNSDVTFSQTENSGIFAASKTYSFTVSKIANTLAVDATHTMKIGEQWTNVITTNSDAELSVNNTHEEVATYNPASNTLTAHQAGTTTITFSQAETYKYTAASLSVVVTANKKDPAFTWNNFPSSMSWAQSIDATCSSTNTSSDCPITITSKNPEIAYYADGKIYAYNKSGTATFTVHQEGNDYEWSEKSQNFSITVNKPNNHVEVNVTNKSAYNALNPQNGGKKAASIGDDGKITFDQGGFNWDDSYVDLTFTGVPNQLSFTTSKSGAATDVLFYVKEYVNGSWSGEIYNKTSAESPTITLSPKANKVRLCYSGNLTGNFSSVRITERTAAVDASDMTISGTHRMGDAATTQNLDINWYNVPQLTVTSSNPKFTFNGNETFTIPSSCDHSGNISVPITYSHSDVTTGDYDEAIITFTSQNGVYKKTVTVKGRTDKKVQTLSWKDLAPVFRQGQEEAVAQSNQGLTPVYTITSSDPMGDDPSQPVFELTEGGTKIKGLFPGTATITAMQSGNETVEGAESISKTFKVSYKKAIQIKWNQNLMKLKSDGEPVTLTAKAYEQDSETGELVENTSQTAAITYSSDNTSIVSISGSTLTIMGIGTTTIRAHIDGDDDFESADIAMSVKIRDASIVGCDDPLVLYAPDEVEFFQMSTSEIVKNEIVIDRSNGKHPDKLSFQHKGEYWKLVINYYKGNIKAQQKVNGSWSDIAGSSVTPTVGTYNLKENLQLNPDATHIRFVRPSGGQGYHYIKDVEVTLKHSLEVAETEHDFGTKKINEENVYCDFTINYFNIKANSLTVSASGDVTVDKTETKDEECGTIGSDVVRVSLNTATEGDKSGTVTFKDAVTNQSLTVTFTGNIEKLTPEIVTLPIATATERLENPILADLTLQGGEASVEGTFTWKSSDTPVQEGDHTYWVVFTPSNTDLYKNTEFEIHVVLSSKTQYIEWDTTTEELYCGESITFDAVSKANSDNSETGFEVTYSVDDLTKATISDNTLTTLKAGTVVVTAHQVGTFSYLPAPDVSKTIIIQPNVFTGEGGDDDWNNPANWRAGVPTDETPDASVKGDLTIQSDRKVNIFTIESGASVTIKSGATLTIEGSSAGRETYGDIIIENGGKLVIEETSDSVCAQNVYLSTSFGEHSSSQVIAAEHLSVHGDAFFDITLADDANPNKWHAFTVPFPVDARNGIYDSNNNPLTNEVNYAIMSYHGDVRAQGKYGWAKFRNIMTPGTFYLMTVDGTIPTFRFRKTTGSDLAATNLLQVAQFPKSSDAQITDAGWNGIGNSQLYYVSVDAPVQVLNPESYTYELKNANEYNFTVGTPFFYQASADGSVVLNEANGSNPAYAPARVGAAEIKDVNVMLSNNNYTDHLYLSATDEATAEYQIGRDLVKMTMTATPSVPQIFALAYNTALCMVDAPMTNDEAQVSVRLYAPASGEYTLSVSNAAAVEVYLLRNGMPVWNLSGSAYTLDLEKGNTEGYSLRLRRAHKQTTDMDAVNGSDKGGVQKVIMDNQLYILRGGQIYTVTGQIR